VTRAEGRLYGPLVWSLVGALAASGCLLTILMLTAVIGPFRFLGPFDRAERDGIGLWLPIETGEIATRRRIEAWRAALPRDEALAESRSLDELRRREIRLIVVADARALSPYALESLRSYLLGGGAAVLAGSLAVRSADGRWLGYERMARLLRTGSVGLVDADASRAIAAWHRGPLSSGLAPGEELALLPEAGVPALDDPEAELRWAGEPGLGAAASRRLAVGRGRLVWLAAGPESIAEPGAGGADAMRRLVGAALAWAGREPALEMLPWPNGAPLAGQVLTHAPASWSSLDRRALERRIRAEIEESAESGTLARIGLPAARLGRSESERLWRAAISLLREHDAWIAPRGAVAEWSLRRTRVTHRLRRSGPQRLTVDVTNRGDEEIEGLVLRVHLNAPCRSVRVAGTKLLQELPGFALDRERERVDLPLPALAARSTLSFHLDVEPGPGAS
jgi:hypothetical protein